MKKTTIKSAESTTHTDVTEERARAWFSQFGPSDVGFTEMRDVVMAALAAHDASASLDDPTDG